MWDSSCNFQNNVGKRLRKLNFTSLKKVYYQDLQTMIYVDWNKNLEGLETYNAWKKPRLRKVLLLCAIWGKVCTLLTFSASWDEWYLSQTTLLNRTLKRTKMPTLRWCRTLSARFLMRTYFVPHSQVGSTKLMENVSAIVIKRLLITWAIFTIITCVRVKTRWHQNNNHCTMLLGSLGNCQ